MNTYSQHDSFALQFPVFEIQNHADMQIRDPQIHTRSVIRVYSC